jgi:L-lactate dehydrogenase complex protein LldG
MGDRERILSRIRRGIPDRADQAPLFQGRRQRKDRVVGREKDALLETFRKECEQLSVDVRVAKKEEDLREILLTIIEESGKGGLVTWEDPFGEKVPLDQIVAGKGVEIFESPSNPSPDSDARRDFIRISSEAGLGISSVDFVLAGTGTLVLKHVSGRDRACSLLPPVYAAFVESGKIIEDLDEFLEKLQDDFEREGRLPSCITLISGPSKTADIEMTLVHGVHGPGKVYVVVVDY